MKKQKLFLLLVLMTFTQIYLYPQELNTQQIYEKCLPSIVTLKVIKTDGSIGTGSAFLISEDGMAVTAWHVAENSKAILAKFSDGEEFEISGIKDKDISRDICLLKIKCFGKPKIKLSATEPKVGEKVAIIGAPKGLEFSISDGVVSQIQLLGGIKQFQFTCPASAGNSGSPLINSHGEVIGVVSWQVREGQNLNFAIPSTYVLGLDQTLPTVPLLEVKNTEPIHNSINDDNSKDIYMAEAFTNRYETYAVSVYISQKNIEPHGGYREPLPPYYFTVKDQLKIHIEKLISFKYDGISKENVRIALIDDYQSLYKSLELIEEGIKTARNNGGWSSDASENISKSYSAYARANNLSVDSLVNAFRNSTPFLSNLDEADRALFEKERPDWIKYVLGVAYINSEPLRVLGVSEKSLAEEIGFKIDDQLIDINEKKVNNFDELKKELANNLGKEVSIHVSRYSESWNEWNTKTLDFDVPVNLVEKYPGKH